MRLPVRAGTAGVTQGRPRTARPEKAIQRAILDFLATVPGVYAFKAGSGMFPMIYKGKTRMVRMGQVGVSDIVGWVVMRRASINVRAKVGLFTEPSITSAELSAPIARFICIEVKRPGHVPTPEQGLFLMRVRDAGGLAIVAHSVDDVVAALGLGVRLPAGTGEGCRS